MVLAMQLDEGIDKTIAHFKAQLRSNARLACGMPERRDLCLVLRPYSDQH
jgi:hypothetical protein